MARRLDNWIDAFMEYTSDLPSPEIFRQWSAITCIAGALERKVWLNTFGGLYPNMYIILVAHPGVGKSIVTRRVEALWESLSSHHLASSSLTKASLVDDLRDAERIIIRPQETPPQVKFFSLKILSNELGILLPSYDNDFMNVLTGIYDGETYSERRRSNGGTQFKLENPQLNILAGTTPSYLNAFLPEGAWDQGFTSRILMVYSGERILKPLFEVSSLNKKLWSNLKKDLAEIGRLYGEVEFTPEAVQAISDWHMNGGQPAPDHPKLRHYLTRRTAHLLKLCMVACVSMSNELVVTIEVYLQALEWLITAEFYMPDIFKAMNTGGDAKAIEECWYYCMQIQTKYKRPVEQHKVYQFLQSKVPAHSIERIVEIMCRAKMLKEVQVNKVGVCYIPLAKKAY